MIHLSTLALKKKLKKGETSVSNQILSLFTFHFSSFSHSPSAALSAFLYTALYTLHVLCFHPTISLIFFSPSCHRCFLFKAAMSLFIMTQASSTSRTWTPENPSSAPRRDQKRNQRMHARATRKQRGDADSVLTPISLLSVLSFPTPPRLVVMHSYCFFFPLSEDLVREYCQT